MSLFEVYKRLMGAGYLTTSDKTIEDLREMKLLVTFAFYDLLVLLQRHWVPRVP